MQNIHYECSINDKKENGIQILKRYFEESINENNQSEDKQNNNSKITANTNGGFQY